MCIVFCICSPPPLSPNKKIADGYIITEWSDSLWRNAPADLPPFVLDGVVVITVGNCTFTSDPYFHSDCGYKDLSGTLDPVGNENFDTGFFFFFFLFFSWIEWIKKNIFSRPFFVLLSTNPIIKYVQYWRCVCGCVYTKVQYFGVSVPFDALGQHCIALRPASLELVKKNKEKKKNTSPISL